MVKKLPRVARDFGAAFGLLALSSLAFPRSGIDSAFLGLPWAFLDTSTSGRGWAGPLGFSLLAFLWDLAFFLALVMVARYFIAAAVRGTRLRKAPL